MKAGYYIDKNGNHLDFNSLKEPYRTKFNQVGLEANTHGYELHVKITNGGNYEGKVLSYWFHNPETGFNGEIFKASKVDEIGFTTYSLI